MIGNDYVKDIKPSKALSMKTMLHSNKNDIDNNIDADYIISSMEELVSIVDRWGK